MVCMQAEDGVRGVERSRELGDVYKGHVVMMEYGWIKQRLCSDGGRMSRTTQLVFGRGMDGSNNGIVVQMEDG